MISVVVLQMMIVLLGYVNSEKTKYCIAVLSIIPAVIATLYLISQIEGPGWTYTRLWNAIFVTDAVNGEIGFLTDSLSIVVGWILCILSAITNFYTIGYVRKNVNRFLRLINSYTCIAILFCASDNLLQMCICLELLAVISYFLISFDEKQESVHCAFRTIAINKLGDVSFIISIALIFHIFGDWKFDVIAHNMSNVKDTELDIAIFTLLISIFIKSAQIGASSWLRYAMKSLTPASALVHSSTLVAAGVLVIIRMHAIFDMNESARAVLITMGCMSAVVCSCRAIFATDIKQILAYSSSAQVGLMLISCGCMAYGAAVILFVAHTFVKSLMLFASGSVIYSLSGEQNIEKMGRLFELLPITYVSFLVATISMISIPPFSYYYAMKSVLYGITDGCVRVAAISSVTISSCFSVLYLFRVIYKVFHSPSQLNEISRAYVNENEKCITGALLISAFFALVSGGLFYYGVYDDAFWKENFAIIDEANITALFVHSVFNLIWIIGSVYLCQYIVPHDWSITYYWNIPEHVKRLCTQFIHVLDTVSYKKCCIYLSRTSVYSFDSPLLLIGFLLICFLYLVHGVG